MKPRVKLIGEDGHAFDVLARCQRAAREAGWSTEQIAAFRAEATSGNYDHLLATVMQYFDVE